jgi:hypothetical protein
MSKDEESITVDNDSDKWKTPRWLMRVFDDWFDPCPSSPLRDGLAIEWEPRTYVNPPYSNPAPWVEKAIEEHHKGKVMVLLLRVDTSTKWFADLLHDGGHVLWFSERLHFNESKNRPSFASMLVILA